MRPEDTHAPVPRWAWGLFAALLLGHVALVLTNLDAGVLVGLEFRQAQTAISAHFIKAEHNYSLAYPTPVLGKPWSIPMEFPLYQWVVAWLSDTTGWSLTMCARLLSAVSFYAMLPALFRLLGQLGLPAGRRLIVLAVVLSSPLYIFYSRAFLIEATALAFSAWFLTAFVEVMRRRSGGWFVLAVVCGAGAALVKVTTFMLWCLPAAAYGAWCLWRDWRAGGRAAAGRTLGWGLASALPVLATGWWWVALSDEIKRRHLSGEALSSSRLQAYNLGTWSDRLSPELWTRLVGQWHAGVMPVWLAAAAVLVALAGGRTHRRPLLLALGFFSAAQLMFPQLYSIHDYYFYAAGVGLLVAVGVGLAGLVDSRLPRALVWGLVALVLALNLNHYRVGYRPLQLIKGPGGSGLTDAIRNTSPPDSVIIVVGDDWNSMIPYYAQRRALMVRAGLEHQADYLERAFADLRGEDIYGLVTIGVQRANRPLIERAIRVFKLDAGVTYSFGDRADVYVRRFHRNRVLRSMGSNEHPFYNQVVLRGEPDAPEGAPAVDGIERLVQPSERRTIFAGMNPAPVRYNFAFEVNRFELDGHNVIGAHPVSTLWFAPPAGERRISFEFGIVPGAYASAEGHTDGADFTLRERHRDGTETVVYQRRLDPFGRPEDRGLQTVTLSHTVAPGGELVFETGSGEGGAFDWCYWGQIRIE
jgi:hypothetical protein